jgi:mRNA interferase MazF
VGESGRLRWNRGRVDAGRLDHPTGAQRKSTLTPILIGFGDIILVPFPFTDQTTSKRRPAIVVSNRAYNTTRPDVVVMAVTSQLRPSPDLGEIWVGQWQAAGLIKPSAVKPVFATLEQALVIRQLGILGAGDQAALRKAISETLG